MAHGLTAASAFWIFMIFTMFSVEVFASYEDNSDPLDIDGNTCHVPTISKKSPAGCLMQMNPVMQQISSIRPGQGEVSGALFNTTHESIFRLQNATHLAETYRPQREAVVIRTTTSPHSVDRWKHWAEVVRQPQFSSSGHHVWLSVDVTVGNLTASCEHNWKYVPAAGNCLLQDIGASHVGICENKDALLRTFPGLNKLFEHFQGLPYVGVHVYSEKDISSAFPDLPPDSKNYQDMYSHPLGWGFGPQTISMLWHHIGHQGSARYDNLWALQDDTRFGSKAANASDELLRTIVLNSQFTSGVLVLADRFRPVTDAWRWKDFASPGFLSYVPQHPGQNGTAHLKNCQRLLAGERVQRLSANLLDEMDAWCGKLKRCSWGEMFVVSVAFCTGLGVAPITSNSSIFQGSGEAGKGYCSDATQVARKWSSSSAGRLQKLKPKVS